MSNPDQTKGAIKAINTPTPKPAHDTDKTAESDVKSSDQDTPVITDYASL